MIKNQKNMNEVIYDPFFYKDYRIASDLTYQGDKNDHHGDSPSSQKIKSSWQTKKELSHDENNLNERLIQQLEDENFDLFKTIVLQEKRILKLEEKLYDISGGRIYF